MEKRNAHIPATRAHPFQVWGSQRPSCCLDASWHLLCFTVKFSLFQNHFTTRSLSTAKAGRYGSLYIHQSVSSPSEVKYTLFSCSSHAVWSQARSHRSNCSLCVRRGNVAVREEAATVTPDDSPTFPVWIRWIKNFCKSQKLFNFIVDSATFFPSHLHISSWYKM